MPPLRKNPVKGLRRTKKKLNKIPGVVGRGAFKGQIAVALLVKKDAQKGTPRRQGNLANSAYVTVGANSFPMKGENQGDLKEQSDSALKRNTKRAKSKSIKSRRMSAVGFGVVYALSVHDNPTAGAAGAFFGPIAQIKRRKGPNAGTFETLRAEEVHSQVGGWKFLSNAVSQWYSANGQMNVNSRAITQSFIKKELAKGG